MLRRSVTRCAVSRASAGALGTSTAVWRSPVSSSFEMELEKARVELISFRQKIPRRVMSVSEFQRLVEEFNISDDKIAALEQAGVIKRLNGCVHGHAPAILSEIIDESAHGGVYSGAQDGASTSTISLKDVQQHQLDVFSRERHAIIELAHQLRDAEAGYREVIAKAARWRRIVWSGALAFSGTQMAIISRLTFFDLEWDVMEPISYFLGTGTSLLFFAYMLKYGVEHSNSVFYKHQAMRHLLNPKVSAYIEAKKAFDDAVADLERKEAWLRSG